MSTISAGTPVVAESVATYYNTSRNKGAGEKKEEISITKKEDAKETEKKTKVGGRTIGEPALSENAAKYYAELKKKYGNLDFILVSRDQKEFAKANASKYSNTHKMVVLIDEDKIERMAEDENYRKQYEGIISKGASGLSQLTNKLANMGLSVKSCGINVNDNGAASFFATMDQSFKAQNKAAQQRLAKKKAAKKAEEKKAAKKEEEHFHEFYTSLGEEEQKRQEKLEAGREERRVIREEFLEGDADYEEEITFTADSVEDLLQQIENAGNLYRRDILSDHERQLGRGVDFVV